MVIHTIESVMCTVLVYAYGRSTVVTCHILTLASRKWHQLSYDRYMKCIKWLYQHKFTLSYWQKWKLRNTNKHNCYWFAVSPFIRNWSRLLLINPCRLFLTVLGSLWNCRIWGRRFRVVVQALWQMWWRDAGTPILISGRRWTRWCPCWKLSTLQRAEVWSLLINLRVVFVSAGIEDLERFFTVK